MAISSMRHHSVVRKVFGTIFYLLSVARTISDAFSMHHLTSVSSTVWFFFVFEMSSDNSYEASKSFTVNGENDPFLYNLIGFKHSHFVEKNFLGLFRKGVCFQMSLQTRRFHGVIK